MSATHKQPEGWSELIAALPMIFTTALDDVVMDCSQTIVDQVRAIQPDIVARLHTEITNVSAARVRAGKQPLSNRDVKALRRLSDARINDIIDNFAKDAFAVVESAKVIAITYWEAFVFSMSSAIPSIINAPHVGPPMGVIDHIAAARPEIQERTMAAAHTSFAVAYAGTPPEGLFVELQAESVDSINDALDDLIDAAEAAKATDPAKMDVVLNYVLSKTIRVLIAQNTITVTHVELNEAQSRLLYTCWILYPI